MPVLKIWNLAYPKDVTPLCDSLTNTIISIKELGLKTKDDVTIIFPTVTKFGFKDEVIVEISGLFEKPERTPEVRKLLAASVGKEIKNFFPEARVECFIQMFNPENGFWVSN